MLRRGAFLAIAAAAAAAGPRAARAQTDVDPASSSPRPALRVLLGRGDAAPAPGGGFVFDGRPFRGTFSRLPDGSVVNLVDLEQYLYAVVPHEMPSSWQPAALQAQAICARTYVLARSNPQHSYDVVPSEVDQVYPGVAGETPAGSAAVDATAGQVLRFGANFAAMAYSSCCGGHTEASSDAWGGPPLAYLGGVVCPYCTASPNYRWTAEVALEAIAARFAAQLGPFGTLHDVRVSAQDGSGRARAFELVADRGSAMVKGTAFRLGLGTRVVRSLLITGVRVDAAGAALDGGGLGHGVGLCQWGAQGMALAGRGAADIVAFYFPGTQVGAD